MTAISGRLYGHYGVQNIPLFAYPLARVLEKTRSWRTAKTKATNVVVLIGLACMLLLPDWAAMQQENYQTQSGNDPEETADRRKLDTRGYDLCIRKLGYHLSADRPQTCDQILLPTTNRQNLTGNHAGICKRN